MKAPRIGPIVLIALATLAPSAQAQEHQISSVPLVQTVKPTPRTYPGVQADIMGIRIGMTAAQAEAIATKTYFVKPQEEWATLRVSHNGVVAFSRKFLSEAQYEVKGGNARDDWLVIYFTNPAAGSVVYRIYRRTAFQRGSKRPLVVDVTSDLLKKYGPTSNHDQYGSHWWQFGAHSIKPCTLKGCFNLQPGFDPSLAALKSGIVMQISAHVAPYVDETEVSYLEMAMADYQLESDAINAEKKQLVAAAEAEQAPPAKQIVEQKPPSNQAVPKQAQMALTGIYVPIEDTTPLVSELKENADNILDITGAVTGHALVLDCTGGTDHGVRATTSASADSSILSSYALPTDVFQKHGLGPVTYNGKKYDVLIQAYGNPPGTTNVDVRLDPVKGQGGSISSGNTLVGGSVAIATAERSVAFTFDHAVLKLESTGAHGPSVPANATVTITGKAYCNRWPQAPLPQALMDKVPAGSLRFVSATRVNVLARDGEEPLTYKVSGNQVQVSGPHGSASMTIDSHGCLDAPEHTILCKR